MPFCIGKYIIFVSIDLGGLGSNTPAVSANHPSLASQCATVGQRMQQMKLTRNAECLRELKIRFLKKEENLLSSHKHGVLHQENHSTNFNFFQMLKKMERRHDEEGHIIISLAPFFYIFFGPL